MDDAPRANLKAFALAGLLALMGAGCGQSVAIQKSQLVIAKDYRGQPYVDGVSEVCSFENAAIVFPESVNWSKAADAMKEKERQGWELKKFCYVHGVGGGLVMERSAPQHAMLMMYIHEIGADPAIYSSESFALSPTGTYDGEWGVKVMNGEDGVSEIRATTFNHDLSDGWLQREVYAYAAGGSPENVIMSIENCAQQNADQPATLNIKIPLCKN